VVTILVHRGGRTERAEQLDPAWLDPGSQVVFWVDFEDASAEEASVLRDVFHFHELAIEDALSEIQLPKAESYDGYLYLVVHGIDFEGGKQHFATHEVDFFLGPNYLVSLHDSVGRTMPAVRDICVRNDRVLGDGSVSLLHRLVDTMVDHYQPEVDKLEAKLDTLESEVLTEDKDNLVRRILTLKRDIASLRRVASPQRDILARLARREFPIINTEMAYRFRDVYDHVMRVTDEALMFQDRVTGILEAHLTTVSNRLNEVMKVLTVISTIFMPLTVLTSMYGMNLVLPHMPGGDAAQFWWVLGIMLTVSAIMLWFFRRRGWV
jgi:magnesium transporter